MKNFLVLFISFFIFTSCGTSDSRLSTEQLTKEVQADMLYYFNVEKNMNAEIKRFSLIRESSDSNKYQGIMYVKEPRGEITVTVEVIYDGENMMWEILSTNVTSYN